ncbi:hypothetical protein AB7952_05055 [Streptomyces sp. PG2]
MFRRGLQHIAQLAQAEHAFGGVGGRLAQALPQHRGRPDEVLVRVGHLVPHVQGTAQNLQRGRYPGQPGRRLDGLVHGAAVAGRLAQPEKGVGAHQFRREPVLPVQQRQGLLEPVECLAQRRRVAEVREVVQQEGAQRGHQHRPNGVVRHVPEGGAQLGDARQQVGGVARVPVALAQQHRQLVHRVHRTPRGLAPVPHDLVVEGCRGHPTRLSSVR